MAETEGFKMGTAVAGRRKMQAFDEPDAEVIQKTRERIVAVEAAAEAKRAAAASKSKEDPNAVDVAEEETDAFDIEPRRKMQTYLQEKEDKWDCESVLSLRSNLENHPARITEPQKVSGGKGGGSIKLSSKTGMPAAYATRQHAPSMGLLKEAEDSEEASTVSGGEDEEDDDEFASVICTERKKDETPEEKKARKAAVKEAKREARATKKQLKGLFKDEGSRQKKQQAGAQAAGTGGRTFVIA